MADVFCGIDFGTSNTTVGVSEPHDTYLLPLEGLHCSLPSAMFFEFGEQSVHYGRQAIEMYLQGGDGRFMRALKSILGTSLIHEKTYIQRKSVPFSTILGFYFANLKAQMEFKLEQEVSDVVLGRPVRFVDADDIADAHAQRSLEAIAKEQGFKNIEFQYEPIAAALDYEQRVNREELVLIVDIGGGTSDFSVVRVSPARRGRSDRGSDILSNEGIHIGGTDFDRLLSLKCVMPSLGFGTCTADRKRNLPSHHYHDLATWHRINQLYKKNVVPDLRQIRYEAERRDLVDRFIRIVEERQGHAIAIAVEEAKIDLTLNDSAIRGVDGAGDWAQFHFSRNEFNDAVEQSVGRIVQTVQRLLRNAGIQSEAINTVFLTGGSSTVPTLREGILSLFPQARTADSDLFGSVGLGLAIDAKSKFSAVPKNVARRL